MKLKAACIKHYSPDKWSIFTFYFTSMMMSVQQYWLVDGEIHGNNNAYDYGNPTVENTNIVLEALNKIMPLGSWVFSYYDNQI